MHSPSVFETVFQKKISRRDFIKYSSGMALVSSPLINFAGCNVFNNRPDRPTETGCLKDAAIVSKLNEDLVFEKTSLSGIPLNNRIFRSATAMGLAEKKGTPTIESVEKHVELARGGVGCIITEGVAVQKNGVHAYLNPLLFDGDEFIDDYKKLTRAVHTHNTPIIMQAFHAGRQTRSVNTGFPTVAPSAIIDNYYNEKKPQELSDTQIEEIIDHFVSAIERAQKAEFDGVQINAAHGYLLSGFLSPAMNQREDQWGGSSENRFRIIRKIFENSRKRVGNFPILIKINAYDDQSEGMRLDESIKIAQKLQNVGCDAIEVSCGVRDDGFSTVRVPQLYLESMIKHSFRLKDQPLIAKKIMTHVLPLMVHRYDPIYNYNVCAAREIKKHVTIPIIVVGGIRDIGAITQVINEHMADYIAMSRPFIIEPDLVNNFKTKKQSSSECLSCGLCAVTMEDMTTQCHYGDTSGV